jgi:hypothetical protein
MASQIHMLCFHGNPGESAEDWLQLYDNFAHVQKLNQEKRRRMIQFSLKDHALAFFNSLAVETKDNMATLSTELTNRFNGSDCLGAELELLSLSQ